MSSTFGTRRRPVVAVLAVVLATFLAACGDDDSASSDSGGSATTGDDAGAGESSFTAGSAPDAAAGGDPAQTGIAPITVEGDPLPELTDGDDDVAVGMAAPSLTGVDYDGEAVAFTPGEGPTLLVFLAHWCPHCNEEIPTMLDWQDSGGEPEGLDIIGVSTGVNPTYPNFPPGEWLAEKGWAWPVIADDGTYAAARAFGLAGFPFMVLVDADGTVVQRVSGEQDADQLTALVAQVV